MIRKRTERKKGRRNFWKLCLFTLFLIYPSVSSTMIRTFVCREVEGVYYLQADFQIKCYEDTWNQWSPIAALLIIAYPIGIPLLFFIMVYSRKRKNRLDEYGVRSEVGFLYDAYERQVWWFEMADMLHKLCVTSLIAFLPPKHQMPGAMIIVFIYMAIILIQKPYLRKVMIKCIYLHK